MTCDRKSSLNPVQNEKERLMLQVMVLMLAHRTRPDFYNHVHVYCLKQLKLFDFA